MFDGMPLDEREGLLKKKDKAEPKTKTVKPKVRLRPYPASNSTHIFNPTRLRMLPWIRLTRNQRVRHPNPQRCQRNRKRRAQSKSPSRRRKPALRNPRPSWPRFSSLPHRSLLSLNPVRISIPHPFVFYSYGTSSCLR